MSSFNAFLGGVKSGQDAHQQRQSAFNEEMTYDPAQAVPVFGARQRAAKRAQTSRPLAEMSRGAVGRGAPQAARNVFTGLDTAQREEVQADLRRKSQIVATLSALPAEQQAIGIQTYGKDFGIDAATLQQAVADPSTALATFASSLRNAENLLEQSRLNRRESQRLAYGHPRKPSGPETSETLRAGIKLLDVDGGVNASERVKAYNDVSGTGLGPLTPIEVSPLEDIPVGLGPLTHIEVSELGPINKIGNIPVPRLKPIPIVDGPPVGPEGQDGPSEPRYNGEGMSSSVVQKRNFTLARDGRFKPKLSIPGNGQTGFQASGPVIIEVIDRTSIGVISEKEIATLATSAVQKSFEKLVALLAKKQTTNAGKRLFNNPQIGLIVNVERYVGKGRWDSVVKNQQVNALTSFEAELGEIYRINAINTAPSIVNFSVYIPSYTSVRVDRWNNDTKTMISGRFGN